LDEKIIRGGLAEVKASSEGFPWVVSGTNSHGGLAMAKRRLALMECFAEVVDPRLERTKLHLLCDILALSVLAVIAGAEGWEDIEEFGRQKQTWLKQFLRLPNGIPSHDTISRLFRALKPAEFQAALTAWMESWHEELGLKLMAIDGKTARRSHDRGSSKSALHLVCAWSVANHLVLGQQATDAKSNEITAIPELLKMLELKGAIITIDAMGCQKEIARQIVDGGGEYVLAVKENQPKLHAAIVEHFTRLHETDFAGAEVRRLATIEKGHGREEQRHYYVTPLPASMQEFGDDWKQLTSVGQVINITQRDGREVSEVRYHILSLAPQVKRYAAATRGHWSIENCLHWVLDVTFREDECRIRKDHGPENFATIRRAAVGLIKRDKSKGSVRKKRKRAAWNNDALLNLLY
jgi:predicted transposase YbfD/YdcC